MNPRNFFIIAQIIFVSYFAFPAEARVIEEHIYIVPAGAAEERVLKSIKDALPRSLPMTSNAAIEPALEMPKAAYDASRKQYDARAALDELSRRITLTPVNERVIVITDADLYVQGMDFALGLADPKKGIAIISLARLKADYRLFIQRALKEAVYELGHSWGLEDCADPKCVMCISNSLSEMDKKRGTFCHGCRSKLSQRNASPILKMPRF